MKVLVKGKAMFASSAKDSRASALTLSILLMAKATCPPEGKRSRRPAMMALAPSVRPRLASISKTITSASAAPPQAAATMERSSLRRGRKMPGVSTNTICEAPCIAMPRIRVRVVCTLWVTIDTLAPTILLIRVDLPAFGSPIRATKPARCGPSVPVVASCVMPVPL